MARRRHSNRRRRRGNFGFLYKLLSVLVICAAVVMALTLFFRVDTIEVTGTERYTEKDVIEASGIQLGDNLFLLNKYEAARSIAEQLPYIDIEDIRIRRELPDTLLIDVAECGTPLAVIQDGSAWLLSPKGKIVEQLPASQAGDYAVIDGCELLAPSVGTDIALSPECASCYRCSHTFFRIAYLLVENSCLQRRIHNNLLIADHFSATYNLHAILYCSFMILYILSNVKCYVKIFISNYHSRKVKERKVNYVRK